ncbi:hypothetical protein AOLI_G00082110 [Acnodon oligacanthus]
MEIMEATMWQVPEGHERLVGGQRCSDLEPVLVTGTWASISGHPKRSTQATTWSTVPLKGTRGSPFLPGRHHHRPSTQQNIGSQAPGRRSK